MKHPHCKDCRQISSGDCGQHNPMPKEQLKCSECQFERSKHGTYEYEPHSQGCSKYEAKTPEEVWKERSVPQEGWREKLQEHVHKGFGFIFSQSKLDAANREVDWYIDFISSTILPEERAKANMRAFEILHKAFMDCKDPQTLDTIEGAQQEILADPSLEANNQTK